LRRYKNILDLRFFAKFKKKKFSNSAVRKKKNVLLHLSYKNKKDAESEKLFN